MKNSQIKIRFNIFSSSDRGLLFFDKIKTILPETKQLKKRGDKRILSDGRIFPKTNKETSFQYELFIETSDINKAHSSWVSYWSDYLSALKNIRQEFNYELHLNYEITVFDFNYPSIYITTNFSSILSEAGIDFSLYIYNEE